MSPKRLKWTGLACLAFSALSVGIGFLVQVFLVLVVALLHGIVLAPSAVLAPGSLEGPVTVTVPRVLSFALLFAGLFLTAALLCFFEAGRRGRTRRLST